MKKITLLFSATCLLYLASCNSNNTGNGQKQGQLPKPGTIIAQDQMPITDDALNHFTFSVKVIADSDIALGVYDVDADFGPNFGEGTFTMPKGAENIKPVIRKSSEPYTFIIGFRISGDTTFYDYFQVSCTKNKTRMEYIRSYTF